MHVTLQVNPLQPLRLDAITTFEFARNTNMSLDGVDHTYDAIYHDDILRVIAPTGHARTHTQLHYTALTAHAYTSTQFRAWHAVQLCNGAFMCMCSISSIQGNTAQRAPSGTARYMWPQRTTLQCMRACTARRLGAPREGRDSRLPQARRAQHSRKRLQTRV